MPSARKSNHGLPPRVYLKHGAYWYVSRENRWLRLGATQAEMYTQLARHLQGASPATSSMKDVFTAWRADTTDGLRSKQPKTQRTWESMLPRLEAFFGEAPPRKIRPYHIKQFMTFDRHTCRDGPRPLGSVSANRHVEVLSAIFSWAIQRGVVDQNPCAEVRRNPERSRTVLPTSEQFLAARKRASPHLAALMDFAYVSGARRGDLIRLQRSQLGDEGIAYVPGKTAGADGRTRLIPWTPDTRAIVDEAFALQRQRGCISSYVFTPPRGSRWSEAALDSAWQRLQAGFHFHDIRAMAASRHEDPKEAQKLLAHSGELTTAIYRRGVVRVTPVGRLGY